MPMQEPRIQAAPSLATFGNSVAVGAIALVVLAVALAAIDRGAPFAWLDGRIALWLLAILAAALAVSLTRWAVEWRRGVPLLPRDNAIGAFAWAIVLFQLASLPALLALGLADTILLVARSPFAALLTRALLLLLVGGAWLTIAAGLVRDLLLLARRR